MELLFLSHKQDTFQRRRKPPGYTTAQLDLSLTLDIADLAPLLAFPSPQLKAGTGSMVPSKTTATPDEAMEMKSEYLGIKCEHVTEIKCEHFEPAEYNPTVKSRNGLECTRVPPQTAADSSPHPPSRTTSHHDPPTTSHPTTRTTYHPATTLLQLPTQQHVPQNLILPAYYLFLQRNYSQLLNYIRSTPFPPADHPTLQTLWFEALYEQMKDSRGFALLNPAQKYRIRCKNPIPPNISSIKFKTNNMFDENTRAVLDKYFQHSRYLHSDEYKTIMLKTSLSQAQIKNYFKNKRSRGKSVLR